MNIIDLDSAAAKRRKRNRPQYIVKPINSPPVTKLLVAYQNLWTRNPLWLKNLHPSIPNPCKYPEAAIQAAWALLDEAVAKKQANQPVTVAKAA